MSIDVSGINEIVGTFRKMPDKLEKARDYAIGKTKPILVTAIKRNALKRYNISKETLFKKMRSYPKKDEISIYFKGQRLSPLSFEDATPRTPPILQRDKSKPYKKYKIKGQYKTLRPQIPYSITYSVLKGQPKRTLSPARNVHSDEWKFYRPFLMPNVNASGDQTKYFIGRKTGKQRKAVQGIKTLSIPQMISNERVSQPVQEKATEAFMRYFANKAAVLGAITKEDKNRVLSSLGIKVRR